MPGIYIHIPFCKQACHYCDFHFSVSLERKNDFLEALLRETDLQKDYFLKTETVSTIYFGGGTPSILTADEIKKILDKLKMNYPVLNDAEITLEANPDDLTNEKLKALKIAGINRLSIGVQSFSDEDLKFMNRSHDSKMAFNAVNAARENGFSNITIDLIYGTPTLSNDRWIQNLEIAFDLGVPHLSCYSLTAEPKTPLAKFIKSGKVSSLDEAKSAEQFELLMRRSEENGYEHYEISNFAKDHQYSLHNSNYWRNEKYLGLGPSAHSYNKASRQWNVSSNAGYIESLRKNKIPFEREELNATQRYNEYILTSLRTIWGSNLETIEQEFGESFSGYFNQAVNKFIQQGWIEKSESVYRLTREGKYFADQIAAELFQ